MGSAWVVFWEPHACGGSAHGIVWPPEGTCAACIVAAADEPQHVSGGGPGPPQPILAARGSGAGPRPRGAMGLMDPFCCMGTEGV